MVRILVCQAKGCGFKSRCSRLKKMRFSNFEFFYVLIGFVVAILLAGIIIIISYVLNLQQADTEKISAYECGFQPFEEARTKFDIKFYLVAILFIIFDLEIMFLFPWISSFYMLDFLGIFSMYIFLILLVIGFYYEWKKGALDWS